MNLICTSIASGKISFYAALIDLNAAATYVCLQVSHAGVRSIQPIGSDLMSKPNVNTEVHTEVHKMLLASGPRAVARH